VTPKRNYKNLMRRAVFWKNFGITYIDKFRRINDDEEN
jgi:hypothetical protein